MAQQEQPPVPSLQDAVTRATPEPRPRPPVPVGDQLRVARERRGEGVFEIADYLRIKADFLHALERGAYDRLPADAYVIGFLRSYAEYLGLDSVAIRAAYRQEITGRLKTQHLTMPQPLPEGRSPHALFILGGIVLAIAVYAVWYFSIAHQRAIVSAPPLPSSQEAIAPTPPQITPPMPLPGTAATAATAINMATTTGATLVGTPSNGSPAAITLTATSTQVETRTTVTPVTTVAPQSYGKTDKSSHITIRAVRDSTITVTDAKGKVVFSQNLAVGDIYYVPDQAGLKLTSANAEDIAIAVNGKDVPKLGKLGQAGRNIPLDPALLAPKEP